MSKIKVLLASAIATIALTGVVASSHSVKAYADTLSDLNLSGNNQNPSSFAMQEPTAQSFANYANIPSNFYIYNIPGVQRIQYGTSGQGRPLYYYKIGNGNKTLFANFAIHGYEDSWSQDGYQLTKIAHQLIEKFNQKNKTSGLNGWSVIIVPCANPDGILDGWTNNGPGRTQISKRIDLNRDFPTYFKPMYDARNYTGPEPLGAPEAKDLANLVAKVSRQSRDMVLLDTHGWLDMTIGDNSIGHYFVNSLGLQYNKGYIGTGHGYLISYGHAEGAEVSLVELPWTTSASQVTSRNYAGKMYTAMNEVMSDGTGLTYMNKTGVLTGTSSLNIRTGANTSSYILGKYYTGDSIHIVGQIDGYYKVYNPELGFAYVSDDYVRITGNGPSIPGTPGSITNGWEKVNGSWYYFTNGNMQTGWQSIGNKWYHFNSSGIMQTGWVSVGGSWYYLNSDGAMQTGWQEINGTFYYLNSNGIMQTGWMGSNGSWYYLNSNGAMQTGWEQVNGSWYYLNSNGAMQTGWQQVSGSWYYMSSNGIMQTGWMGSNGSWYYLNSNGIMQTGWQQVNGSWYYLNSNGAMQTGWQEINGTFYYMNSDGIMQTGWIGSNGSWYYMNSTGSMHTGWIESDSNWYFMNDQGAMHTGWQQVGSTWYYMNSEGIMQTGLITVNKVHYYLDSNGAMLTNTTIDGWKIASNGVATKI